MHVSRNARFNYFFLLINLNDQELKHQKLHNIITAALNRLIGSDFDLNLFYFFNFSTKTLF